MTVDQSRLHGLLVGDLVRVVQGVHASRTGVVEAVDRAGLRQPQAIISFAPGDRAWVDLGLLTRDGPPRE